MCWPIKQPCDKSFAQSGDKTKSRIHTRDAAKKRLKTKGLIIQKRTLIKKGSAENIKAFF